ncbi:MAG: hypothetical protein BGO98_08995 [Myxococcales bacterium 68-20]|nr:hypothetical protein [Myxococcales bacterium]OJY25124.1 MAG: hypothetical protein BGO98_08995 [Myxococcales bacterium 68-20]
MKITAVLTAASLVFGLVGCASSSDPKDPQDPGIEDDGIGAAGTAPDTNPDGEPYPTESIGHASRKGTKAGNRIANYKFLGYPDADVANGLQPISLAQYFDPTGKKYKIVHIQAAGVWCGYCKAETQIVVPMKAELEAKGVVWLVSLAEGPTPGTASKQKDLEGWIATFKSPYTHWLDPANANLGPFYDRSALPWNANIDATTMEILTSGTGAVTTKEGIIEEVDKALELAAKSTLRKNAQ